MLLAWPNVLLLDSLFVIWTLGFNVSQLQLRISNPRFENFTSQKHQNPVRGPKMLLVSQCVAYWCAFCDLNSGLQCLSIAIGHQEVNLRFENLTPHRHSTLASTPPPSFAHLIYQESKKIYIFSACRTFQLRILTCLASSQMTFLLSLTNRESEANSNDNLMMRRAGLSTWPMLVHTHFQKWNMKTVLSSRSKTSQNIDIKKDLKLKDLVFQYSVQDCWDMACILFI